MLAAVAPADLQRTGVLVLRIWVERESDGLIRARITEVSDLRSGEQASHVASDVEEIVAFVREWVAKFVRDEAVTEA